MVEEQPGDLIADELQAVAGGQERVMAQAPAVVATSVPPVPKQPVLLVNEGALRAARDRSAARPPTALLMGRLMTCSHAAIQAGMPGPAAALSCTVRPGSPGPSSAPPAPCLCRCRPNYWEQAVLDWAAFAQRQHARYVPPPPDARRMTSAEPSCFRLRVLRINGLPSDAPEGKASTHRSHRSCSLSCCAASSAEPVATRRICE